MHNYFYPERMADTLDLSKIRMEAARRAHDSLSPTDSTIHFHEHGLKCEGYEHEAFYIVGNS